MTEITVVRIKNQPATITMVFEPAAVAGLLALSERLQDPAANEWVGSDAARQAARVALDEICWQLANAGDRSAISLLAARTSELDDRREGAHQGEVESHVGIDEKDRGIPDDRG